MRFDEKYWSERYKNQLTGWDAGSITTPLKDYIDQLEDRTMKILIPGCGYGHEAKYLYDQGFSNVVVIDFIDEPVKRLRSYCQYWEDNQFIVGNFFDHTGEYDLILEQTFFSSLEPSNRSAYARRCFNLLKDSGKLVGLLFTAQFSGDKPPFGGTREEYIACFEALFEFVVFEPSYNSIKPRKGNELFMILIKRKVKT